MRVLEILSERLGMRFNPADVQLPGRKVRSGSVRHVKPPVVESRFVSGREFHVLPEEQDGDTVFHDVWRAAVTGGERCAELLPGEAGAIAAAGLDPSKASRVKPLWASGLSSHAASGRITDEGGSRVRGFSPRILDDYWAAFARFIDESPADARKNPQFEIAD